MKSRCFRGHVSGCSKNNILKSRIQFCSHECLLAAAQLICWLWEGMWLLYCPQNHDENVFISKKMRHMQAILVVSVSKQSAHYFFCYLAFGVIKSSLSRSWDKGFFTWEALSHHIQKSILSWIVLLSYHIYKSWDIISLSIQCRLRRYLTCELVVPSGPSWQSAVHLLFLNYSRHNASNPITAGTHMNGVQ